jgi:putative transposase
MIIGDYGKGWSLDYGEIRVYPRTLGVLKAVTHRMPPSTTVKMRRCVVNRTAHRWHAVVSYQLYIPDPARRDVPVVGIDRGVAYPLVDSTGRMVLRPAALDDIDRKIRYAQRRLAKKKKGSSNRRRALARVARLRAQKSAVMRDFLHKEAYYYATTYGVVVLEDLKVKNMTASAKGDAENPGTNVKAKSGLNRAILELGWSEFKTLLDYKLQERGGVLVTVPAHYSSQTCSSCGHVSANNRRTRDEFVCEMCGYEDHADVNAAKNLVSRRPGGAAACGGTPIRGPMKQESPVARPGTHAQLLSAQDA